MRLRHGTVCRWAVAYLCSDTDYGGCSPVRGEWWVRLTGEVVVDENCGWMGMVESCITVVLCFAMTVEDEIRSQAGAGKQRMLGKLPMLDVGKEQGRWIGGVVCYQVDISKR